MSDLIWLTEAQMRKIESLSLKYLFLAQNLAGSCHYFNIPLGPLQAK